LQSLGFQDGSDPVISNKLGFRELGYEDSLTDKLEATLEATSKYQKEIVTILSNFFLRH
jgi:hypothetical protein